MNSLKQRIQRLIGSARNSHGYKLERAILRFTELLSLRMKAVNLGPTELAAKIDAKPPYISKILRGKSNFTFDSIIKLCSAVDADFVFDLVPKDQKQKWVTVETGYVEINSTSNIVCVEDRASDIGRYNRVGHNAPMVKFPRYELV